MNFDAIITTATNLINLDAGDPTTIAGLNAQISTLTAQNSTLVAQAGVAAQLPLSSNSLGLVQGLAVALGTTLDPVAVNTGGTVVTTPISGPTVAPRIESNPQAQISAASGGTVTVQTVGTPTAAINIFGPTPAFPVTGGTFKDNGDGSATLTIPAGSAKPGTYPVTFTAANGAPPNSVQFFTLTLV